MNAPTIPGDLYTRDAASAARMRWVFVALALVIPLVLGALFERQNRRLRALADRGAIGTAFVTRTFRQGGVPYTEYAYTVDGERHEWTVGYNELPLAPGQSLAITYLPGDPALSRPGAYTLDRMESEVDPRLQRGLLGGAFAFFVAFALWSERARRRSLRGKLPGFDAPPSPDTVGRILAVLIGAACIASLALDPKAVEVSGKAFGTRPFGLPVALVVAVAQSVLYLPYLWVFPHLMRIVMNDVARGGGVSKLGIATAVVRADGPLRRSRAIVLAGLGYFVALCAAWIGYAEHLGI